ncbi:MAG: hypothetical protein ACNA8W_06890 [Bradymonadaceae bacterium]
MKDRSALRGLLIAALTFVGAALVSAPTDADALDIDLGARLGLNYNLLTKPHDPAGEPTLMHGSAFSGMGFTFGPAATMPLLDLDGSLLALEVDLLYSYHSGRGFEEFTPEGGATQRRTVSIATHAVRVPVLVKLSGRPGQTRMRVGVGPDLVLGLASSSTVSHENIPEDPVPLETAPKTHLTLTTAIGLDWYTSDLIVPFEVRVNWNPFVGSSTRERFEDYQDLDNPGIYSVAFDWQIMFMTGVSWSNLF